MKINSYILGFAGAISLSIIYTSFATALMLWPTKMIKFIGITHMIPKLEYISSFVKVTPSAIGIGLITHAAIGFLFFWLLASIYNLFQK